MSERLVRRFFARSAEELAPDLIGRTLVRVLPSGERLAVRLVETEAYGPADPASHAFNGRTRRNAVMFGPPGHLYVYFVYGMHWCANVVAGSKGEGSAVLLRAGAPLDGIARMSLHRQGRTPLAAGPARLAQALALSGEDDGIDLSVSSACWIEEGEPVELDAIGRGPRIGLRVATDVQWRFREVGSPFVSGPRALNAREAPARR